MYDNDFSIVQMLRAGASGYLHKTAEPEELDCALQTLFTGGYYHTELESANPSNAFNISVREREFLTLCCRELVYKEIAAIMKVSIHTVNGYRDALFIKLNLHSRTALAIFALEVGIVTRSDLKEEQEPPW
jgi:DNA-binding NarL/FixJ family response regulator